jgi:ferredoxin
MEKIIEKKDMSHWVNQLSQYTLFGPVAGGENESGSWHFKQIESSNQLDLNYLNTGEAPKIAVFPQNEILFSFVGNGNGNRITHVREDLPKIKPQIILGIRPCDARAIAHLDQVFGGEIPDPYYWQYREETIMVGLGCKKTPSSNCFCTSVGGSPYSREGLDVLMTEIDDYYYLESLSIKGSDLMASACKYCKLFRQPKTDERKTLHKIHKQAPNHINRHIDELETVSQRLGEPGIFESQYWEQESMACIRCGICTYLCPSCHCFDITDEVDNPAPLMGKRVRNWDTCQFPDFTMHSSGHNPRPGKASRLRRRVLHKFRYFMDNHNSYLCTGCGRCVSQCPVGIDIIDILNKVAAGNAFSVQKGVST